jgi:hypothetical protein
MARPHVINIFRFYGYFASFIGTVCLVLFVVSAFTKMRVELGLFGLYGIPILGLIYSFLRTSQVIVGKWELQERNKIKQLESEIAKLQNNQH